MVVDLTSEFQPPAFTIKGEELRLGDWRDLAVGGALQISDLGDGVQYGLGHNQGAGEYRVRVGCQGRGPGWVRGWVGD